MPKTTFQRVVYTLIGVFLMANTMALYNKALVFGGLSWALFAQLPMAFAQRAPLAFVLQFFVVQKVAARATAAHTGPADNPLLKTAIRVGFTVLMMCPIMSLYSNLLYGILGHTLSIDLLLIWVTKMVENWLFAFFVQIFWLIPLKNFLFRAIFRRQPARPAGA